MVDDTRFARVSSVYRELNIMNRVSNKGFSRKSCKHSKERSFSDVFCPASGMQSGHRPDAQVSCVSLLVTASGLCVCTSLTGDRMRSGTAC